MLDSASTLSACRYGWSPAGAPPAGPAGGPDIRMVGERPHHLKDGAVLQKGQLAGAEVIQQCTKRFRSNRHLGVQPPAPVRVEHAVSRPRTFRRWTPLRPKSR